MSDKKSRTLMYVQKTKHLASQFTCHDDIINHLNKYFNNAEWAYILHNRDLDKQGNQADDHIHIGFYFNNPRSTKRVADLMGDKEQSVEVFSGRWAKNNMFAYLLHRTAGAMEDGSKHAYDLNEVTSNFDYKGFMEKAQTSSDVKQLDIEEIKTMLAHGELKKKDFHVDGVLGSKEAASQFYAENKNVLDKMIEAHYNVMMKNGRNINLEIIYIQGTSGSGKTVLAKEYATRKYGDYFITGSSNDSVQDYMGEPVAIFDDARPSDFTASDWLKMLDPYNNKSTITSRYYNKYLAVKCIIITTTTPFHEFFVYAKDKGGVDEPVSQFMRRFQVVIDVSLDETDFGDRYAVGQLYRVERLPQVQNFPVGDKQTMVKYEHTTAKEDGKVIRAKIPEEDPTRVVDDVMRYF